MLQSRSNLNKFIPISKAEAAVIMFAREAGFGASSERVFQQMLNFVPVVEGMVSLPELTGFLGNMQKALEYGDHQLLFEKRGLRVSRIADLQEFVESPEYMHQKGHIRPAILSEMIRLFEAGDYVEAVLTGAIGIGKNYFADLAMAYQLYLLSVYWNPQAEFGLAPGSNIVFIMQSMKLQLAQKVVFEQFGQRLLLSPYFKKNFPPDASLKTEMRFPANIIVMPVGGNDTGAIGMNVFGGVLDELNFMARTVGSTAVRHTHEEEFDQAERLYTALIRRMKSRFLQLGKLPGKLLLISSVNYPGDFTDRKIDEAKKDKTIFVMKLSLWEAIPKDRFLGTKFLVEVGNEVKQSRIISSLDEAVDEQDVIEVPIEYRTDFERDLVAALRDIGGIATGSTHPFIPYRQLIQQAQDNFNQITSGRQLFTMNSCILSKVVGDLYSPEWENIINMEYIEECILDHKQVFAVHIDVGITNDAAGVAIGRVVGDKMLPVAKYYDDRAKQFIEVRDLRAPIYQLDGLLQILPPPGGEIDLELVRDMIGFLSSQFNLQWASMDSYQSAMLIQGFRRMKIRSGVLSVDATLAPYTELKQSIKDERLRFPVHLIASKELREVEKTKKEKIDHPVGGTKDVADAMAGVVYILSRKEARYGRTGIRRRSIGQAPSRIMPSGDMSERRLQITRRSRRGL